MLFSKKKKIDAGKLFAPATGKILPIAEVPDKVFAEKVLGDGVAIILKEGAIVSPADGKIINVADTLHAYGIETTDGLELLVHVGINTVELGGQGFDCKVREGQKIKRGELLCTVDLRLLEERGYPLHTPTLITNADDVKALRVASGDAVRGETVVMEYDI